MTKSELIESAGKLQQPSGETASEFEEKSEQLASDMNKAMLTKSNLALIIGEGNEEMMIDNHKNHARFMSSVFTAYQPQVLVETVLWVFSTYRSHGFKLLYWPAQLNQWIETYKTGLSQKSYDEIYPFYNWLIINQPAFAELSNTDKEVPVKEN